MTSFADAVSARDPRWPQLNTLALESARDSVPPGQSWCLFSYWRRAISPAESREQHSMILAGLNQPGALEPIPVQTLMAHYRVDEVHRTRFEPWIFASGRVKLGLADWFCSRFRCSIAFWGDQTSMRALTRNGTRSLGAFRPSVIAHAICESSSEATSFLGFDLPAADYVEALARTVYVGAAPR